jgi:hypothetical protein
VEKSARGAPVIWVPVGSVGALSAAPALGGERASGKRSLVLRRAESDDYESMLTSGTVQAE